MAFSTGGTSGRRPRDLPALAEINVTPFVDVALVLLIIFMITAHAMESGIEIQVPKTTTVSVSSKELPIVSIDKSGEVFLGKDPVRLVQLAETVRSRYPAQTAVYVRADRETPFDPVAQVLSVLGNAKIAVNVVTQPDENIGKRNR
jgi:biopolymer transport protein ExbD